MKNSLYHIWQKKKQNKTKQNKNHAHKNKNKTRHVSVTDGVACQIVDIDP